MASFISERGGVVIVEGAKSKEDNGHWRLAQFGGWCLYEGSAYSKGRQARPELQRALAEFDRIAGGG